MAQRLLTALTRAFSPAAAVPAGSGKQNHYLGLDLLRGIAALAVVLLHCRERFELKYLCPHGYLAVDFFFVLSGFVIARAYYDRLSTQTLSLIRFALIRIIRLMPLIVLGTIAAAAVEFGRPGVADQREHILDTAQALLFGSLLIPIFRPTVLIVAVFPLIVPVWSLFFEAVANAVFAICAKLGFRAIVVPLVAVLSGMLLAYGIAVNGTVDIGARPSDFWFGFGRVGWSFTIGILLFHFRDRAPRVSFDIPFLLLATVLIMPIQAQPNDVFDIACVLLILPLIVWLASTSKFEVRGQRMAAMSGDLSYPLYALHFPFLRIATVVTTPLHLGFTGRVVVVAVTAVATNVVAALAYAFYDVPLRKWLTARLKRVSRPQGKLTPFGRR